MAKKKKLKGKNVVHVPSVPKKNAITADDGLLRFRVDEDLSTVSAQVVSTYLKDGAPHALRVGQAIEIKGDDFTSLQPEIEALTEKIWDLLKAGEHVDF